MDILTVAQAEKVGAALAQPNVRATMANPDRSGAAETPVSSGYTAFRKLTDLRGESQRFIAERRRRSREIRFDTLRRMSTGSATEVAEELLRCDAPDVSKDLPGLQQSTPIRASRSRGAVEVQPYVRNKVLKYRQRQHLT
jgi:hypothetical protein